MKLFSDRLVVNAYLYRLRYVLHCEERKRERGRHITSAAKRKKEVSNTRTRVHSSPTSQLHHPLREVSLICRGWRWSLRAGGAQCAETENGEKTSRNRYEITAPGSCEERR